VGALPGLPHHERDRPAHARPPSRRRGDRHVEGKGLRSAGDTKRLLRTHILPSLGELRIHDIKRRHIAGLLDHIEDKHGARQADICLAIIRKAMNWYATRDDDFKTPVIKGMGRYDAGMSRRSRIFSDDEIRSLWAATAQGDAFSGLARTLLLTGQRRDKVATMKWSDVVDGEWRIRAEKRENTSGGILKLPLAVLDIIAAQPRLDGNPYVFAGRGRGPINAFSQRKEELDARLPKMPPWVLHDCRHTARSLMSRAGVSSDHGERVLGHKIAGVEDVYDRHSYDAEKAAALSALASLVERIIHPAEADNVTELRKPR
jgi:integrase